MTICEPIADPQEMDPSPSFSSEDCRDLSFLSASLCRRLDLVSIQFPVRIGIVLTEAIPAEPQGRFMAFHNTVAILVKSLEKVVGELLGRGGFFFLRPRLDD